jgi:hypothetical protein
MKFSFNFNSQLSRSALSFSSSLRGVKIFKILDSYIESFWIKALHSLEMDMNTGSDWQTRPWMWIRIHNSVSNSFN